MTEIIETKNEKEIFRDLAHKAFQLIYAWDIFYGERVYDETEYEIWLEGEEKAKEIANWEDEHGLYGYFVNSLMVTATRLYIIRNFKSYDPKNRYEEKEIYVLK